MKILGLIIDAFGDLREQLDSVKETLEVLNKDFLDLLELIYFQSKCFICGIGQEYFDKEPHGFEVTKTSFVYYNIPFLLDTYNSRT